jgi:hypothetical protein
LPYIPAEKNQPALDFLESVGAQFKNNSESGCAFRFPAAYAATITYKPVAPSADGTNGNGTENHQTEKSFKSSVESVPSVDQKHYARIASELSTLAQILAALRSSPLKRQRSAAEYVAPRNATETTLTNLWAELLGLERVGIHDDFFALGGHSLLATQTLSRVRDVFRVELPLQTVFVGAFTIAELARVIGENQVQQSEAEDVLALMEKLGELSDEQVKELLAREETIV